MANLSEVPAGVEDAEAVFVEPLAAACEILDQVLLPTKFAEHWFAPDRAKLRQTAEALVAAAPTLDALTPTRSVRCLLYVKGASQTTVRPDKAPVTAAASVEEAGPGKTLLEVKDLRVRFPIRKGFLQRTAGYFDAVAGVTISP